MISLVQLPYRKAEPDRRRTLRSALVALTLLTILGFQIGLVVWVCVTQ